jgi:hypothetical protein
MGIWWGKGGVLGMAEIIPKIIVFTDNGSSSRNDEGRTGNLPVLLFGVALRNVLLWLAL